MTDLKAAHFFSYDYPEYKKDSVYITWDSNSVSLLNVYLHPEHPQYLVYESAFRFNAKVGTDTDEDADSTNGNYLLRKRFDAGINDTVYWWLLHVGISHFPTLDGDYQADRIWLLSRRNGILGFGNYRYHGDSIVFWKTIGDPKYFDQELVPLITKIDPPPAPPEPYERSRPKWKRKRRNRKRPH